MAVTSDNSCPLCKMAPWGCVLGVYHQNMEILAREALKTHGKAEENSSRKRFILFIFLKSAFKHIPQHRAHLTSPWESFSYPARHHPFSSCWSLLCLWMLPRAPSPPPASPAEARPEFWAVTSPAHSPLCAQMVLGDRMEPFSPVPPGAPSPIALHHLPSGRGLRGQKGFAEEMPGICRNLALLPDLPSTSYTRSISWRRDEGKAQSFSTSFHLLFFCRMRSVRGELQHRGHQDIGSVAGRAVAVTGCAGGSGCKKKKAELDFFCSTVPMPLVHKSPCSPVLRHSAGCSAQKSLHRAHPCSAAGIFLSAPNFVMF